ncbi:MAG: hypothetical protein AAB544_04870 [Patescibacteria group bacterium]
MPHNRIYILDEETDRLAASKAVLGKLFPDDAITFLEWDLMTAKDRADAVKHELLGNSDVARLLIANILGVESGLFHSLVEYGDPSIDMVLTSCATRTDVLLLHDFDLDQHAIPSVETGTCLRNEKDQHLSFTEKMRIALSELPRCSAFYMENDAVTASRAMEEVYSH